MTADISAQLNESHRSALLAYYLGQFVPNSGDANLARYVKTPEDAYEYLLIDPLVSNDVNTSRVAEAISSIQQYIDGISINMEPGYRTSALSTAEITAWNGGANQYGIWAGEIELQDYPENYIDPTLRKSKTTYFSDLETKLNQNQINADTAQSAVLGYLDQFEQVANLQMVSGYLNGRDQKSNKYYFLGCTRSDPVQYYWRSLDMARCNTDDGLVPVDAWTEWLPVNVPLGKNVVGKVRLVIYNNRLYVVWFERTSVVDSASLSSSSEVNKSYVVTISCYAACLKFDGSWSSPQLIGENNSKEDIENQEIYADGNVKWLSTMVSFDNPPSNGVDGTLFAAIWVWLEAADTVTAHKYAVNSYRVNEWFEKIDTDSTYLDSYFEIFRKIDPDDSYTPDQADPQEIIQYSVCGGQGYDVSSLVENDDSGDYYGMRGDIRAVEKNDFNIDVDKINLKVAYDVNSYAYQHYPQIYDTVNARQWAELQTEKTTLAISDSYFDFWASDASIDGGWFYKNGVLENTADFVNFYKSGSGSRIVSSFQIADELDLNEKDSYKIEYAINSISKGVVYLSLNFKFSGGAYKYNKIVSRDTWASSGGNVVASELNLATVSEGDTLSASDSVVTDGKRKYTYVYGIQVVDSKGAEVGKAYRSVSIQLDTTVPVPCISTVTDAALGTAEYLSFDADAGIAPIRLNTLFARELINKASVSIDALLSWDTQNTPEPSLNGGDPVPLDFNGANGLYFWELFFYMPYMVAHRFNQQQGYDDAATWFHHIFDPAAVGRNNNEPDYWSVRPLVEQGAGEAQASLLNNPADPDAIAMADPVHYQKAVFDAYLSNLIDAADADYRLLTNDGLTAAKLRYCQAKDLLGPRPDVQLVNQWVPDALAKVAGATSVELRQFESGSVDHLYSIPGRSYLGMAAADNSHFTRPLNTQLLSRWNTLDARLYNLRHNLTLDGQPMTVPLYAPPVNPTVLMQQSAQSGSLTTSNAGLSAAIPPYRFTAMLQSARAAVNTLAQFGQTLLSYYERGDGASLQELQQQQLLDISSFTISLQQQNIDALNADREALEASQAISQQRHDFYKNLFDQGISSGEMDAMNDRTESGADIATAEPLLTSGAALNMAPNLFGFSDGGCVWGAVLTASGLVLQLEGQVMGIEAERLQTSEGYARRSEEWQIQYQQAQSEVSAVLKQLDALAVRQQAAQTALQQAQAEQANFQSTLSFLKTRFTQSSLYNWLSGQLSALYYQAYDAVLSLCLSTQACWQYEMGDATVSFIQTGAWNNSYHGLLVGETLALNLVSMESAWLTRNQRRLELTKTISLKQTLGMDLATLASTGYVDFTLSESLFDNDYPGHYMRQLKFVSVSLPTLVGPYEDVRATLTQSGSYIVTKPDITAVQYLNDPTRPSSSNILSNPRASQQVAISTGLNDSGLFVLSFGDERYLPFEGTGAVSNWRLSFPRYACAGQQAILAALNDVIVQVHYTAIYGGSSFEAAVEATLAA